MPKLWIKKLAAKKWPLWVVVSTNAASLLITAYQNSLGQHFCIPVIWFGILLALIAAGYCVYPLLHRRPVLQKAALLVSSVWLWVYAFAFLFCIYGLFADGIGNLFPFYFIYMFSLPTAVLAVIIARIIRTPRIVTGLAVVHGVIAAIFIGNLALYSRVSEKIEADEPPENIRNQSIAHAIILERITGMHFKYHTRLCLWDGWRPPLLDPLVSVGYMLYGDPLNNIGDKYLYTNAFYHHNRVLLYKRLFPGKTVVEKCSCPGAPINYFDDLEPYK